MKILKLVRNMHKRIKVKLRLWKPAGVNLTILHDDVFLVSYPKSGNTWVRFLLGQARLARSLDFASIEYVIPDIYQNSDRELLRASKPRVLKSHEMYTELYPRVIYLVRDPRDVAISFYYWREKTGSCKIEGLHINLADYLHHYFSEKELYFSGWGEHVESWVEQTSFLGDRLLTLRYEDIEQSPKKVLQRVVGFLGWDTSDSVMDFSVKYSAANRMRKAEDVLSESQKQQIPFVREARSGQWKEVFDGKLNAIYWERFGKWMEKFDYTKF